MFVNIRDASGRVLANVLMGNSASNSSARVDVCLEKAQYHAGETVNGYVQVNVQHAMTCNDVYATLKGEVLTKVQYTEQENRTDRDSEGRETTSSHTVHRTAYGHETIIEDKRLVARFPSGANPGFYQFPFSFQLHPALPSSANVGGVDSAQLTYGIEVHLERPGMFQRDLVQRTYFDLAAQVPHAIVGTRVLDEQNVKCCCCIHRGSMQLSAHLEKNAFCASEAVQVIVELQNRSSRQAKLVNIEVKETISFRAQGHASQRRNTLAAATLPAVAPGSALSATHVVLRLPPQFNHCSLQTSIMQITHHVEVRADTPCCNGNPAVKLPVKLYRSPCAMAFQAPPSVRHDETVHFVQALPYSPDSAAMTSPVSWPVIQAPAVVPSSAQALQYAPMQQPMAPAGVYPGPSGAAAVYPQNAGSVYPQGAAAAFTQSASVPMMR